MSTFSQKWQSFCVMMIVLAPFVAALVALVLRGYEQKLGKQKVARLLGRWTTVFSLISLLASILVASAPPLKPLHLSFFYLDDLSIYFTLLVNLVAFVASWYTAQFLEADAQFNPHHDPTYFHLFFNLFHLTMLAVPMLDNLVILWMAIELTTVFSTLLVRYRRDRSALEASWKFIIITTTGIIFALLGTLFLENAITTTYTLPLLKQLGLSNVVLNWSTLAIPAVAKTLDQTFVSLSFLFVVIGYGTKAGLAPMHTWLPDGHGEAPSPVSALLSGVMLKSALYAILRFYTITNWNRNNDTRFTSTILLAIGMLSLVLATPFILKRNKFKRILAYHSLEHMGIITLGIGIGGEVALFGALLHALNHALTKALMFLMFGYVQDQYRLRAPGQATPEGFDESMHGVWKGMPISGIILMSGGLALVGSPPFNIFMSEYIILWAAIERTFNNTASDRFMIVVVVLFLVSVTLIFGGLVGHISRLLLDKPPFEPVRPWHSRLRPLLPFLVLLGMVLLFGLVLPTWPVNFPQLLHNSTVIIMQGVQP